MKNCTSEKKPLYSKIVLICAGVCSLLSLLYYLLSGSDVIVSIISALVVFGLSYLFISFVCQSIKTFLRRFFNSADCSKLVDKEPTYKEETFDAVGTHYYLKNIEKLATSNPEWRKQGKTLASHGYAGKRVYRYRYSNKPINLIQENNNSHDRNAVMIQIAGEKVGYISAEEAVHVRDILNHCTVQFISAFIGGGDYKEIFSDGTFEKHEGEPFVRVKIGYK